MYFYLPNTAFSSDKRFVLHVQNWPVKWLQTVNANVYHFYFDAGQQDSVSKIGMNHYMTTVQNHV